MKIRALSVFEGVVYHCWPTDTSNPCRPQLEVEAILRPGDADAEAGPLLLSVADYIVMVGGLEIARPCLHELADQGRIVSYLGADHLAFPTWHRIDDTASDDTATAVNDPTSDRVDVPIEPPVEQRPKLTVVRSPDEDDHTAG